MQKKKIVHIVPSLTKGGAERFVVDLCNELAGSDKYEVHLVSLYKNDPASTFKEDVSAAVAYRELDKKSGFDRHTVSALNLLLKVIKPDVVHTHINALEYAVFYKISHQKVRYFHTLHNDAWKECNSSMMRRLRGMFYRMSWITPITISRESARSFHACYKLQSDHLIENGRYPAKTAGGAEIRQRYLGANSNAALVVNVGRIGVQKNQQLLIEAVNVLHKEGRFNGRLLIIGAVQEPAVYEQLKTMESDMVAFIGEQSNVADYMAAADVFCLSSIYEGMPISLIEALSIGCIPVCTPVGGINEMIRNGETGFLSRDLSVDAYKEAVFAGINAPGREQMKKACIAEFNQKYHITITARKHLAVYGV